MVKGRAWGNLLPTNSTNQLNLSQLNLNHLNTQQLNLNQKNLNQVNLNQLNTQQLNLNQKNLNQLNTNQINLNKINLSQLNLNQLNLNCHSPLLWSVFLFPTQAAGPFITGVLLQMGSYSCTELNFFKWVIKHLVFILPAQMKGTVTCLPPAPATHDPSL